MNTEAPVKLTHNEEIKAAIPTLAGTIAATLNDAGADHFSDDDNQFLKFHGSLPAGRPRPAQDRQEIHHDGPRPHSRRRDDRQAMAGVRRARDDLRQQHAAHHHAPDHPVSRHPEIRSARRDPGHQRIAALHARRVRRREPQRPRPAHARLTPRRANRFMPTAHSVAMALAPQTKAYHSIWIDGVQLDLDDAENKNFVDPLYGKTYLPRKFKIAFVIPPVNDLDVFTNCLGFIAIVENDQLVGYNLAVGGGMGRSHGNEADLSAPGGRHRFLHAGQARGRGEGRADDSPRFRRPHRPQARAAEICRGRTRRGLDARRSRTSAPASRSRPRSPINSRPPPTCYGWHKAVDGNWFLDAVRRNRPRQGRRRPPAENRVARRSRKNFRHLEFRLSANQNVILANVAEADKAGINALLAAHGVKTENQASVLHAAAMACPALPTCGLAPGGIGTHVARPD